MAGTRKAPAQKQLFVAKDGFICKIGNTEYLIKQAEVLPSDHPVVRKYGGELFAPSQVAAA
jgi:hypothetical protein